MQVMGIKRYHDRLLTQISSGMTANASQLHRHELERLGRKAVAVCRFQEMLDDLKDRIARRSAIRTGPRFVVAGVELPSQAA
jgi:hypothetical protein